MYFETENISLGHFDSDFRRELTDILRNHSLGSHERTFCQWLEHHSDQYRNIVGYAVDNLPKTNDRPNQELATLFLILSHLSVLNDDWRSLLMDLAVFCETLDSDGLSTKGEELLKRYEKMEL